jgi:hypothetical protein
MRYDLFISERARMQLRDLEKAIAENGDKPLITWEEAKRDLDLD